MCESSHSIPSLPWANAASPRGGGGRHAGTRWHDRHTTTEMHLHMDWGTWAFAHTHTCGHFCACTCTQVQVCRHVNPHSMRACAPRGSLALGPDAAAGIPLRPAPGHCACPPCRHACPVSLQAAALRGRAVPASPCSCAWRASPSSRRSWLTMRRTASGRVSLAGTHTHTHNHTQPWGWQGLSALGCCSHAGLLQTVSAAAPSWRQSRRAERPGPAHRRAAPRRRWAGGY